MTARTAFSLSHAVTVYSRLPISKPIQLMKPGSWASSTASAAVVSLTSSASSCDRTSIQVRPKAPGVSLLPAEVRAA